jgi:hypothetical protein
MREEMLDAGFPKNLHSRAMLWSSPEELRENP